MEAYVRNYIKACEAYGWEGGPEFNTEIIQQMNKAEKRNARWSQSRFFATLPFVNISPESYGEILSMFEDRKGMWGVFLYRNPLNYLVSDLEFGVGDGVQDEFQLVANFRIGNRLSTRNVYAIYLPGDEGTDGEAVPADVTVYVNGVVEAGVTIDHDRGRVLFNTPPAFDAVLTWDGAFSHWVRFNNDRLPFSIDTRSQGEFVTNGMVELIEVNPPIEITTGGLS